MTVSRMLERDDFAKRYAEERPDLHPRVPLPAAPGLRLGRARCDIELGGTDQLFNLLVGRDLMPRYGQTAQMVLTTPLLEGTDAKIENGVVVGTKMSKSADNYVGLDEPPFAMFRKVMQIDDDVIFRYFELLSSRSNEEIAALQGARRPRARPARDQGALRERAHHALPRRGRRERRRGRVQEGLRQRRRPRRHRRGHAHDRRAHALDREGALASAGLVKSTGEGKRLVEQGGVEVDGQRIVDPQHQLAAGGRYLVRAGSKNRRFANIIVEATT